MTYRYVVPSANYVVWYVAALFPALFIGLLALVLTGSFAGPLIAIAASCGILAAMIRPIHRKGEFIVIQNDTLTLRFQGRQREIPIQSIEAIEIEAQPARPRTQPRFQLQTHEGPIPIPARLDLDPFLRAIAADLKIPLIERR